MAIFRQLQVNFWQDEEMIMLTPEDKYFYLYLMTNSHTRQCGIYELPLKLAEVETGYNRETIDKLLSRLQKLGKIVFNPKTKEVCLCNWMKYNNSDSPKIVECIRKELAQVKDGNLLSKMRFLTENTVCILYRNNNKNNNNKKNNNNNNECGLFDELEETLVEETPPEKVNDNTGYTKEFEEFWKIYPRKVNKAGAFRAWKARKRDGVPIDTLMQCCRNYAQVKRGTEEQYILHGSTFLGPNKRYVDYLKLPNTRASPPISQDRLDAMRSTMERSNKP